MPRKVDFRDRIVELRRVPAKDLKAHGRNWRRHPDGQRRALREMLGRVGVAGAAIAYEEKGRLVLIDGHMRAGELEMVPVLVLDVNADEADDLLRSFDPIGAMAQADEDALRSLLADSEIESAELLRSLRKAAPEAPEEFPTVDSEAPARHECPKCGYVWS